MARAPLIDFNEYEHPSKAQGWLEKNGWTEGSGIGANQQGITSALKTKQRTDNGGLGRADDVDETNAWWLDGFLLAARKLQRKNNSNNNEDDEKKKPGQIIDPLCPLYSRFVRASSTTTTTTTTTTTQIVDISKETFDACDGKAARYIMPDAKLARVAKQDELFKEKRKLDDFKDTHKEQRKAEKKAAKLAAKLAAKQAEKKNAKKKARTTTE
jgi:hypothetical protein